MVHQGGSFSFSWRWWKACSSIIGCEHKASILFSQNVVHKLFDKNLGGKRGNTQCFSDTTWCSQLNRQKATPGSNVEIHGRLGKFIAPSSNILGLLGEQAL